MPFKWKYPTFNHFFLTWTLGLNHLSQQIWQKYCKCPAYTVFPPPKTTKRKERKKANKFEKKKKLIPVTPFPNKVSFSEKDY